MDPDCQTNTNPAAVETSPDFVRISMAAAIGLGLKPGRLYRQARCTCINLLENYAESCFANCTYCGLARERVISDQNDTFIRVAWPVYPTELVAERIAQADRAGQIGRVCVSQVQHPHANPDLLTIISQVRRAAPEVLISALVNATSLDEEWLVTIQAAGVDMIGIGLDAATETVFYNTRGRGVRSPHEWKKHWQIARTAVKLYGHGKVNCHMVVGLGETDQELVDLFFQLQAEGIACYLFSFNPEPGTAMEHAPRPSLERWRRIQLGKYLIEQTGVPRSDFEFASDGSLARIQAPARAIEQAMTSGLPFMTNGCPDRSGQLACNRPYGSYRPGEAFRDYPFRPNPDDQVEIAGQLQALLHPDRQVGES